MLLLLSTASAGLPSPDELRARPDPMAAREVFKHLAAPAAPPSAAPPFAPPPAWDIEDYVLAVRIDPAARTVVGRATITAARLGPGDLLLHANGPVISAVYVDGAAVTPTVVEDEVFIPVLGDTATLVVDWTYDEVRPNGIQWGREVVFSFHEPIGARTWLPVYDDPADKASLTWEVTAPDGWVVAANGVLEATAAADAGWTTWRYVFDQPIPTYLMTVHLSDYDVSVTGGDIPVYTWAYPDRAAEAAETFGNTPEMLDYFSDLYAPYPFPSYGNAMAPFGGAMEHTTCVTFSDELVGDDDGELVNVHELGHHWWGDDVTLGTWDDIWLNEGFATYTEALWYEHEYGQEGLTVYAEYLTDAFFGWQSLEGRFPVYDPLYMWGGVVYDKGGMVVHMLRGVLGDDRFFAALSAYEAEHHLGTAVTTDLMDTFEASSGEDLGWFFDQWVYGIGEPTYTWGWAIQPDGAGGWQVDLSVSQDLTAFRMPMVARLTYADGTTDDVSIVVEGEGAEATVCLPASDERGAPVAAELDPDRWVLRHENVEVAAEPGAITCGPTIEEEDEDPAGCGCDGAGGAGGGAVVVVSGLLLVRRRR